MPSDYYHDIHQLSASQRHGRAVAANLTQAVGLLGDHHVQDTGRLAPALRAFQTLQRYPVIRPRRLPDLPIGSSASRVSRRPHGKACFNVGLYRGGGKSGSAVGTWWTGLDKRSGLGQGQEERLDEAGAEEGH